MNNRIYLDNNASTCVDPKVARAVKVALEEYCGNPSSTHFYGQQARNAVSDARSTVAAFLGVDPDEVIFTSGGTEAANLAIRGILGADAGGHIITSDGEHAAVSRTVEMMQQSGYEVSFLPIGSDGAVTAKAVREALRSDTRLIILIGANNETGVKTDVEAVAAVAQEAAVPFIVDTVGWVGKELFPLCEGISGLCVSGHKLHAPKGIGCLCLRRNVKIVPFLLGGPQERGRRAGTENVPGIVGLAEAISICRQELPAATQRMAALRNRLEQGLMEKISGVVINGTGERICNTTNIAFPDVDGETLLMALDLEGIAVSHGSACTSGAWEPSHVLINMGFPMERVVSSLRFSLSRFTTPQEIDHTIDVIVKITMRLSELN